MPVVGAISDWPIWVQTLAAAGVAFMWLTALTWLISLFTGRQSKIAAPELSQVQTDSPLAQQAGHVGRDNTQVSGDLIQHFYFGSSSEAEEVIVKEEKQPPNIHIESQNQQGGITAYQVNIQPGDRELTSSTAQGLKGLLDQTDYESVAVLATMGDAEAYKYASQIKNYLISEDIEVDGVYQAGFTRPVRGHIIQPPNEEGVIKILIGNR